MSLLNKLTLKNLKLNKKRTVVTIIGIILSIALITAVTSMFFSARDSLILFETKEKGNFHTAFFDVPVNDLNYFKENRNIESYSIVENIGYAKLLESKNANKPYIYVKSFNQEALQNLGVNLIEGRLPENEKEILIPSHLKTNGRVEYKVGEKISLDIGKRVSDNEQLNQNNPFIEEINEEIIETRKYEFTIVGIIERPTTSVENYSAPGFTFISYLKEKNNLEKNVDIYVRYTKKALKEHYYATADILGVDRKTYKKVYGPDAMMGNIDDKQWEEITSELEKAKYQTTSNTYLISLETNIFGEPTTKSLGVVVLVVCLIIIFTSVFCIKNSFDISITEKIKQYGMLSSIGATKKQIKKNVYYEAFILGAFGVPIGVISGLFASYLLIVISNLFLKDMLNNVYLIFSFSWLAILFSILLGVITIYLSARKSAHKASKISPISAIRSQNDIKISSKKLKSPKWIKKIFGIGGVVSYKTLKRNKKKYRATVISIIVCVSVFIALSYFMNIAFRTIKTQFGEYDYNISLSYSLSGNKEIKKKALEITSFDSVKQYSIIKTGTIMIKNPLFSKKYLENFKEIEDEEDYVSVYAVGKEEYERYIKELGLDYEEVKSQGILINGATVYDEKENTTKVIPKYAYKKNDKIQGDFDLVIGAVTTKVPFGMQNVFESNAKVIVSDQLFEQIITDAVDHEIIYIDSTNPDKLQDEIDNHLKDYEYNLTNAQEQVKMMKSFYNLIGIFLYGFILVIALIGITNIFNTITTNMELRKQEFAMLKSIGMTKKEFKRMIRLESFFYGMKSLIIGIPIGCILSYLIHHLLTNQDVRLPYKIPLSATLIGVGAVFLLITCIMKYSINKINKQNIIETIRNENI